MSAMSRRLRLFRDGSVAHQLVCERDGRGHVVGIFTLASPMMMGLMVVAWRSGVPKC